MIFPSRLRSAPWAVKSPLDGSAATGTRVGGLGICEPVAPPPGGPGNNITPIAPATSDNPGRAAPVWTTWFDQNGMAQACFPGNVTAEGVGSPGQVGPPGPPGPQGNPGVPGQAATVTVGAVTASAPGSQPSITNSGSGTNAVLNFVLPQGNTGPQGGTGSNGTNAVVRGSVATAASLPPSGNTVGDIWIATDTGNGFSWNGSAWINVGQMRGTQGIPGPVGPAGPAINLKGSVATAADLPTTGNNPNDAYIATDTGHMWIWTGTNWVDVGQITGPQGPQGPAGPAGPQGTNGSSATVTVGTTSTLPPGSPAAVTNVGTSQAAVFNFAIPQGQVGATGNPGPQGATGPQGPAFTPPTTGTGTTYVLSGAPTIAGPTLTGNTTAASITATGTLGLTGAFNQTGNTVITGKASVIQASGLPALPAAAVAGSLWAVSLGGNVATLNGYSNGSNWLQMPGTGTSSSTPKGVTTLDGNANAVWINWAPPAADNAVVTAAYLINLSPTAAYFPGSVNAQNNMAITSAAAPINPQLYFNSPNGQQWTVGGASNSPDFLIFDVTQNITRITIDNAGNLTNAGTAWAIWFMPSQGNNSGYVGSPTNAWNQMNAYSFSQASDPRDKRDIAPAPTGALEKVKAIPVITYRLNPPPQPKRGIADPSAPVAMPGPDDPPRRQPDYDQLRTGFDVTDIQKVHPDCVSMDDEGENPRSYSLGDINAILWQAVQELTAKVEALEAQLKPPGAEPETQTANAAPMSEHHSRQRPGRRH